MCEVTHSHAPSTLSWDRFHQRRIQGVQLGVVVRFFCAWTDVQARAPPQRRPLRGTTTAAPPHLRSIDGNRPQMPSAHFDRALYQPNRTRSRYRATTGTWNAMELMAAPLLPLHHNSTKEAVVTATRLSDTHLDTTQYDGRCAYCATIRTKKRRSCKQKQQHGSMPPLQHHLPPQQPTYLPR